MRRMPPLFSVTLLTIAMMTTAQAGPLADQLAGTWEMVSNTENYEDGSSYVWGPDAKGLLIITASGACSIQMAVGDRKTAEGNPALNPVGRYVGYFGNCAADDAAKTLTFNITRGTYPAWDGGAQVRKIGSISETGMTFTVAKPLPSAKGPMTPTVVWAKVK